LGLFNVDPEARKVEVTLASESGMGAELAKRLDVIAEGEGDIVRTGYGEEGLEDGRSGDGFRDDTGDPP
jgi:hypothetical protein